MNDSAFAVSQRLVEKGMDKVAADAVAEEIVDFSDAHVVTKADFGRLENDMARLGDDLGRLEANAATKADLKRLEDSAATKLDVGRLEVNAATKDDLRRLEANAATKDDVKRLEIDFGRLEANAASKDDLRRLESVLAELGAKVNVVMFLCGGLVLAVLVPL